MKIIIVFLFCVIMASATESHTEEWYYEQANLAISNERYQTAIHVLAEAKKDFPYNSQWNMLLGNMYKQQKLFVLAETEFKEAASIDPLSYDVLLNLAEIKAQLDKSQESVAVYKKLNEYYPYNETIMLDLSWMYFKVYQFHKGLALLDDYIDEFGEDVSSLMTKATLHAALYNYASSKAYYEQAINLAKAQGFSVSASVGHYNLSILESKFYQFNNAYAQTEESIRQRRRAPGYLSQAGLLFKQLNYDKTHQALQQAYALDETPLSLLSLAELYVHFGKLQDAQVYLDTVRLSQDITWMQSFGTSRARFRMQVNRVTHQFHYAKSQYLASRVTRGFVAWIKNLFARLYHAFLAYYYQILENIYKREVADRHFQENDLLEAYWSYYGIFHKQRRIALKYVNAAADIEIPLAEASRIHYEYIRARLKDDVKELYRVFHELDPLWEQRTKQDIAVQLMNLQTLAKNSAQYFEMQSFLMKINPSVFLTENLSFPVTVRTKQRYDSYFKKSIFNIHYQEEDVPYELFYVWNDESGLAVRIQDRETGKNVLYRHYEYDTIQEAINECMIDFFEINVERDNEKTVFTSKTSTRKKA